MGTVFNHKYCTHFVISSSSDILYNNLLNFVDVELLLKSQVQALRTSGNRD